MDSGWVETYDVPLLGEWTSTNTRHLDVKTWVGFNPWPCVSFCVLILHTQDGCRMDAGLCRRTQGLERKKTRSWSILICAWYEVTASFHQQATGWHPSIRQRTGKFKIPYIFFQAKSVLQFIIQEFYLHLCVCNGAATNGLHSVWRGSLKLTSLMPTPSKHSYPRNKLHVRTYCNCCPSLEIGTRKVRKSHDVSFCSPSFSI